jgi:ABC-type transporter Mla subunit MlaD
MPQLKDKVSSFFTWSRKGKPPVEVQVARREGGEAEAPPSKEVTLAQLKQGYGEVVDTMKSLRTHLEQQGQRSEEVLGLMRDLPEVLKSIPESTRTQTRMLEAIHSNLERQNETSGHLTSAITGLAAAANSQEKALTEIRANLAEDQDTRGRLNDGIAALDSTLGHVAESNAATRDSMGAVVEQTRVNDERMREMYQRSQKMNTAMVLLCLALATGALALGGYMAMMVSRMNTAEPTPATAPANQPLDSATSTTD